MALHHLVGKFLFTESLFRASPSLSTAALSSIRVAVWHGLRLSVFCVRLCILDTDTDLISFLNYFCYDFGQTVAASTDVADLEVQRCLLPWLVFLRLRDHRASTSRLSVSMATVSSTPIHSISGLVSSPRVEAAAARMS